MREERIVAALHALAEADREREASPDVEGRLLAALRKRHARRLWRRAAVWSVAAAAAVVAVALWTTRHRRVEPVRMAASVQTAIPVQPDPAASKPRRKVHRARRTPPPRELVTQFFPLMDLAPPLERGELIRVSVPAAMLRTVGLPVDEDRLADRIQADVLVGQEGLPRAIRFVESVN
jgi:hypothetical protein